MSFAEEVESLKQAGLVDLRAAPDLAALDQAKGKYLGAQGKFTALMKQLGALPKEATDFTLPGRRRTFGKRHPLTQVTEDIVRIFRKIGFAVADGPEIEDEYHCFDALNTPADHPARDLQDTFYLADDKSGAAPADASKAGKMPSMLLRTHTSSVQIRV